MKYWMCQESLKLILSSKCWNFQIDGITQTWFIKQKVAKKKDLGSKNSEKFYEMSIVEKIKTKFNSVNPEEYAGL